MVEAQKNYDAEAMAKILAADYVEVSPLGEVDTRAKVLSFYTPERKAKSGELTDYRLEEITTRVYGNSAVVVARLPFAMNAGGTATRGAFRCTFVLMKTKGQWKLVSSQFTTIR